MNYTLDPDMLMQFQQIENLTLGMLLNLTQFNNTSVENLTEYKANEIQRDSMTVVIPVTICYAIIFVAGVLGNVITCTVISRNKSMHTGKLIYYETRHLY